MSCLHTHFCFDPHFHALTLFSSSGPAEQEVLLWSSGLQSYLEEIGQCTVTDLWSSWS